MEKVDLPELEMARIHKEVISKIISCRIVQYGLVGISFIISVVLYLSFFGAYNAASWVEVFRDFSWRFTGIFAGIPFIVSIIIFVVIEKSLVLQKGFIEDLRENKVRFFEASLVNWRIKGDRGGTGWRNYRLYKSYLGSYHDGWEVVESEFLHKCKSEWVCPGAELIVVTYGIFRKLFLKEYVRGNLEYSRWQGWVVAGLILVSVLVIYLVFRLG